MSAGCDRAQGGVMRAPEPIVVTGADVQADGYEVGACVVIPGKDAASVRLAGVSGLWAEEAEVSSLVRYVPALGVHLPPQEIPGPQTLMRGEVAVGLQYIHQPHGGHDTIGFGFRPAEGRTLSFRMTLVEAQIFSDLLSKFLDYGPVGTQSQSTISVGSPSDPRLVPQDGGQVQP